MPSHSRGGYSNALPGEALFELGMLDPTKWVTWWHDFTTYDATDFTITNASGGSVAVTDGLGGLLLITNGATDNNVIAIQSAPESFLFSSTKKMFFKARFAISDATESDAFVGLYVTDTDPVGGITDGIYFTKADGATTLTLKVAKSSTATTTNVTTMVAATMVEVAFAYLPSDSLFHIFVNNVEVATSVATNAPNTEAIKVSFAIQNGEDAIKTMTVDYIGVWLER